MTDEEVTRTNGPGERRRVRDLGIGIGIGHLETGRWNAITDVPGVSVGQTTIIRGEGPLVVGQGPVRTGVTVIVPREEHACAEPVFAGYHILNGNGEMTGLPWIDEAGLLATPVAITNTHSVGVVRDALIAYDVARHGDWLTGWSLPVVAETWDGFLNDINGLHVKPEHVFAALDDAHGGPVAEGNVGGGAGMVCHGFKGGTGTASRVLPREQGGWTVGALVQANHGQRRLFRVDGVPVGQEIGPDEAPLPWTTPTAGTGSIIVVLATDAPLLPSQCRRLAQRATIGVARVGGLGENSSGDIFLAFATGNRGLGSGRSDTAIIDLKMLPQPAMTPLFEAAAEATEEAILNAVCMAATMTGIDGHTVQALSLDRLLEVMGWHNRP